MPIYYEARLAKIDSKPEELPKIDPNFEEVTDDAEEATKENLRRKWAQLEAMIVTHKQIALVERDDVPHNRISAFAGPSTFAGPTVDWTARRLLPNFSVASVSSCSTLERYSEELRIFGKIFSLRALRLCAQHRPG